MNIQPRALIIQGGWQGHHPEQVANILQSALEGHGISTTSANDLAVLEDVDALRSYKLVVPIWTMGKITKEQCQNLRSTIEQGVGLAGCHGGMCDAFRESTDYQWMTGGQWVAHPGNSDVTYTVRITDHDHWITQGISDYSVQSEQYYMHVDPSNHVLAVTRFPTPGVDGPHTGNGAFDMPVSWTRRHGLGRVFYHSVGHDTAAIQQPETLQFITRGMLWAAGLDQ